MAQRYTFPQSGVSSISVDGIEHKIDPDTGELVVEVMTPGLTAELKQRGALLVDPNEVKKMPIAAVLTPAEIVEREALFKEMDTATGKKVDRRRSLQQLREMKADLAAAAATAATPPPGAPGTDRMGGPAKAP